MFWGLDLHAWEQWLLGLLVLAAIGAVGVAMATYAVVKLQRAETAQARNELAEYKADAATKIAAANSAGQAANKDAARANERAAELTEKAAAAELALAELKWRTAWRHIDEKVFAESLTAYSKPTIPIEILYVSHDANSFLLAKQIFDALGIAGWPALEPKPLPPASPDRTTPEAAAAFGQLLGVTIIDGEGGPPFDQKQTARYGLIDSIAKQIGSAFGNKDKTMPDGAFRIIVAPKPPM